MIRRATSSVEIHATAEAAWAQLMDYEQLASWIPGVGDVRVMSSEGDVAVVELSYFGTLVVLEVVSSPPNGARFQQVDRVGAKGVSGSWKLSRGSGENPILDVEIHLVTPFLAFGAGHRLRSALEAGLVSVAVQLQRPPTAQLATYRRALAIVRRGDVIEARIGDEVVELLRIGGHE